MMMRQGTPPRAGRDAGDGVGTPMWGRTQRRRAWLCAALGGLAAGCGSGETQGSLSVVGGGGAPSWDYGNDGPMVAKVTVIAPDAPDFILQATLPVPPGTFDASDVLVPLAVLSSSDTTASPSQVEVVSRYPDPSHGADVVEVISRVRRPDVPPGTPIDYEVVYHPHAPNPFTLQEEVDALFDAPGSVVLQAKDAFGHPYRFDLLTDYRSGEIERVRSGAIIREHKTSGALMPTTVVTGSQGTMPHLMGVHAFVRTYDREDFFALDLHLHNGFDGRDAATPADDVLDELHFERLSLRLPAGWRVVDTIPNPYTGVAVVTGGVQEVDLVKPLEGNKVHYMPRQAQFWRRVYVARTLEAERRAMVHVERRNMGFCQPGHASSGAELWSWWNPDTARFLPQAQRLPELDGIASAEDLRAQHAAMLTTRLAQVASGSAGGYPVESPALGWAHPWGVNYGGMTGGEDISMTIGGDVAWAASPDGYRFYELKARMTVDRQPIVFYGADGEPLRYEDFVNPTGNHGPWQPQEFSMRTIGNDTFGFANAPMHQANAVNQQGRVAPYKQALNGWMSIDLQHYIRFTNNLLVLAWLGNDSLAKEQLEQSAELFRLSHNEAYVGNHGYIPGGGLIARQQLVSAHPGQGIAYGRGEAWGLYTSVAAYAVGDDAIRERFRPWLRTVAHLVREGQSTCTGNITSRYIGDVANGVFLTRQAFEVAFVINALESMRRAAFEGVDPATQTALEDTIVAGAYSTIQAPFWDPSLGGQRRRVGVGRSDLTQVDFCSSIPMEAYFGDLHIDNDTAMTPWAYAYAFTQDPLFLQRAADALGGTGNLVFEIEQLGTTRLCDSSPLLALVQGLASL